MNRRLTLLRHAHAERPAGRCVGQWEHPLSTHGQRQIAALASHWTGPLPSRIVSSDIGRARQTAEILADLLNAPAPDIDVRLREISMGHWEGQSWDTLYATHQAAVDHWGQHWVDEGPPGGESAVQVAERMHAVVDQSPPGTLLVGHGGALGILLCELAGQPLTGAFNYSVANAAPVSLN